MSEALLNHPTDEELRALSLGQLTEAELAARVRHPNIVQLYEIGTHDGRPFLAMEWVEGGGLADRLDGKPWPPDEAAGLSRRWPVPSTSLIAKGSCTAT